MSEDDRLLRGRECYSQRAWRGAWERLWACDSESALAEADLERLAVSAFLVGENQASDQAWLRAHQQHLKKGDRPAAVRCAFWLAFRLLNVGELPEASGWVARIERLLGDEPDDTRERAQLSYLTGVHAVFSGDLTRAEADLARSGRIAERCGDVDLSTLARLALGRVLIFRGDVSGGIRLLDEAMVAVVAEETTPVVVGDSYCTAIDACHDVFDVSRGHLWTEAFARWCERQPDLVPYTGLCLVHRAEFLQLRGAWVEAMAQAGLACNRLSSPVGQLALGAAFYQLGELHRLRGDFQVAERSYRQAADHGRDPQPGLALLRLARGQAEAAARGIVRALAEADDRVSRPQLLDAYVEVMLAVGEVPAAHAACDELAELARFFGSPMLAAVSDRAIGAVRLSEGDAAAALGPLRRASSAFRTLGTTYDVARTSLLISRARRALGDEDGARLELASSRSSLQALGARADLALLDDTALSRDSTVDHLLTAREIQVLRLVAQGATNRSIGSELGVSERTVDRHVSNILAKLGVPSRAAATAFAYESDLI